MKIYIYTAKILKNIIENYLKILLKFYKIYQMFAENNLFIYFFHI